MRFKILIMCLLVSLTPLWSQDLLGTLTVPNARISALGGAHAALADDFTVLYTNPAGYQAVSPTFNLAEFTFWFKGPIFDITGVAIEAGQAGDEDLMNMISNLTILKGLYAGMGLVGPISFGYVGKGLGFGILNYTDVIIEDVGNLTYRAKVAEQLLLTGGYTFRVPFIDEYGHYLDIGAALKGSIRPEYIFEDQLLNISAQFMGGAEFDTAMFMDADFDMVSGIGLDMGIRYSFQEIFFVGISFKDVFTQTFRTTFVPEGSTATQGTLQNFLDSNTPGSSVTVTALHETETIPFKMNAGFGVNIPMGILEKYINKVLILVDYNDILDFVVQPNTARYWLLHWSAGIEVDLLNILSMRFGFNEGLFAAGIGLDLTIFNLNLSMFGDELGSHPALLPQKVFNFQVGLEFKI